MVTNFIDFFQEVGKLKKVKRTGWVREGIPNSESVAEHSYRVSVMAMLLGKNLNVEKLLKMSLIHDLGEIVVGDIVSKRGSEINHEVKENKLKLEKKAFEKLCKLIDDQSLFGLWKEFEEEKSEEAKFLKQIDRLEMAIQAYEYEKEHNKDLTEFFEDANIVIKDSELIKLFKEILSKRK